MNLKLQLEMNAAFHHALHLQFLKFT